MVMIAPYTRPNVAKPLWRSSVMAQRKVGLEGLTRLWPHSRTWLSSTVVAVARRG